MDKDYIEYVQTLTSIVSANNAICSVISYVYLFFGSLAASEITTVESLQFDFGTIEVATNKFSDDNKIGEGGFGKVYKVRRIKTHFLRCLVLKISKHSKFTAYKYEKISNLKIFLSWDFINSAKGTILQPI